MDETNSVEKKNTGKKVASVIFGVISIALFVFYCILVWANISTISSPGPEALAAIVLIAVALGVLIAFCVADLIWLALSVSLMKKSTGGVKTFAIVCTALSSVIMLAAWVLALSFVLFANNR